MSDDMQMKIAKLELAEGDVLVVKVDQMLSTETYHRVKEHFDAIAPDIRKMIIGREIELSVVVPPRKTFGRRIGPTQV